MNKTDCKGCKLMVNCEWSYGSNRPPCSNLQVGSQDSLSQVERASKLLVMDRELKIMNRIEWIEKHIVFLTKESIGLSEENIWQAGALSQAKSELDFLKSLRDN